MGWELDVLRLILRMATTAVMRTGYPCDHPLMKEKKHAELFEFEAVYDAMICNDPYSVWF